MKQLTDKRPVCAKCTKEAGHVVRFRAIVNGVYVPYANTYIAGDLWECPECEVQIIEGFGDPEHGVTRSSPGTVNWRKSIEATQPEFFPFPPETTDEG